MPVTRVLVLGALTVMTISGCGTHSGSSRDPLTTAQMQRALDAVPLPAGSSRIREDVTPRGGADALGEVVRTYRYSGTARPLCRALLGEPAHAGWTVEDITGDAVDPQTCTTQPANNSSTTDTGLAFVKAPHSSVAVGIGWTGDTAFQLNVRDNGG